MKSRSKKIIATVLICVMAVSMLFAFSACDVTPSSGAISGSATSAVGVSNIIQSFRNILEKLGLYKPTQNLELELGKSQTFSIKKGYTYNIVLPNNDNDGMHVLNYRADVDGLDMALYRKSYKSSDWQRYANYQANTKLSTNLIEVNSSNFYPSLNPDENLYRTETYKLSFKANKSCNLYLSYKVNQDTYTLKTAELDKESIIWVPVFTINNPIHMYVCNYVYYLNVKDARKLGNIMSNASVVQKIKKVFSGNLADFKNIEQEGAFKQDVYDKISTIIQEVFKSIPSGINEMFCQGFAHLFSYAIGLADLVFQMNSAAKILKETKVPVMLKFEKGHPDGPAPFNYNLTVGTGNSKDGSLTSIRSGNVTKYKLTAPQCYAGLFGTTSGKLVSN